VKNKLKIKYSRKDYREYLELVHIFFGGDLENKITIQPPGAIIELGTIYLCTIIQLGRYN